MLAAPTSDKQVARLLGGALGCLGFWLNGLGPALPLLQDDLQTTRSTVAVYPSMFAVGLLAVGVLAPSLAGPGRRHAAFTAAFVALAGGAGVLASAITPGLSLVGALTMGLGAAVIVSLVPAVAADVRGAGAARLVSTGNALASAAGVLAPLAIAGAIAIGAGWQAGYLAIPAIAGIAVLAGLRRPVLPDAEPSAAEAEDTATGGGGGLRLWLDLVLAVSIEFCMVFWASSYLRDTFDLSAATATALAGAFLLGMALGRASVGPVTRRTHTVEATILLAVGVTCAGFALFWVAGSASLSALGLAGTGLGVALLYPLTVARYVDASPSASTRASARAALGSGVAIGVAPFALATMGDAIGLHTAYLLVPALCVLLVANSSVTRRAPHVPGDR
jgi:MFS family permease